MRTLTRRRRAVTAVIAVALTATACSDDDDADPSTPTTATTTSPTVETSDDTAAEAPVFTFGVIAPGPGELADLAVGQERGLTLAIDDINADGGVLGGSVTSVRAEESTDDPLGTTLDDLVAQEAHAMLGPVSSASAVDVAALARDRQLLVCSASATAASVTSDGDASTFFRTAMRDDDTSAAVADRIMQVPEDEDPPSTVMVLGRDDIYGTELAGDLAAQLTARGATTDTLLYPSRRVEFDEEVAAVVAADPDVLVLASYAEGLTLITDLDAAGFPVARIVGLDGLSDPGIATLLYPDDPEQADGFRVIRATGDRVLTERLLEVPADSDVTVYGAQMYDCAITIALAAIAAGSPDATDVGAQVRAVTSGGRTCSTFAHCRALLDAGEDVAYSGASGGLEIGVEGDISTTRLTTSTVVEGELVDTATDDIDLVALRNEQLLSASVVTTQLQQAMKLLGYYDGDVTGQFDEETAEALRAMQRDLGVPETGVYDEATDAALRARLGTASSALNLSISQLQLELQALGYYDGPIDGRYSAETIAAVRSFQARLGVPQTGILDTTTLRAVYSLGQQSPLQPPPPPPPPPPVTEPPPPPPPVTDAPPPPPPVTDPPAPPVTDPPAPPVTDPPAPPVTDPPAPTTTEPPPTTTTEPPAPELPTMYAALTADPRFSTLVGLLRTVGFDRDLTAPAPPFTIFAPTNSAFDAMDPDERAEWTDPARLPALLAYHGVDPDAGVLQPADLRTGPLPSIHGAPLDVVVTGTTITVGAGTLSTPLEASNGIVHPITAVLIPPS